MKRTHRHAFALTIAVTATLGAAAAAMALTYAGTVSSASLAKGLFSDTIQVNQDRVKFQTKDPTDFATSQLTFAPDSFTGWHHHSGVVMVIVKSGTVTTHDDNCQTRNYSAGQVFVESGSVPFGVSNESTDTPAVVVATQVYPDGSPARINDAPPACASS